MKKIAIDLMGGDNAPVVVIEGVTEALATFDDIEFLLVGDQESVPSHLRNHDRVQILHTHEKIDGNDEPVAAIRKKKQASMVLAAQAVKEGQAQAILSAGNTGALLAAGLLIVGRIKGVDRPGLMPVIPTLNDQSPRFILMDAGANADSKPINLHQFAVLANYYAKEVLGLANPRIGLVNNGTEENKGNELTKEVYTLLSQDSQLHFIGNVEAKDLLEGVCDIAITDGFTGNAILKSLEGTAKTLFKAIKQTVNSGGPKAKLGAFLLKDSLLAIKDRFDDSKQGGAILLGVKAPVIKAHGSSNSQAIFHAIRQARLVLEGQVVQKAQAHFEKDL
ncbi:TPA: phosphate acyltransferase PlsX [Streptococcus suis]